MASKLIPTDPSSSMTIRRLSPNITTLSTPFARFGRAKIGGRATLIKLPSGAVAVFSPVALTDDVRNVVSDMGTLKYVVAPDMEHHVFVQDWHKVYPEAKVVAPDGLKEKRDKSGDGGVRFDVIFKAGQTQSQPQGQGAVAGASGGSLSVDPEFDAEFDAEYVPAHANKELVFNFRREKTLIEADLLMNLPAVEQYAKSSENPHTGMLTKLFNGGAGTTGSALVWQRRMIWYGIAQDRKSYGESVKRIAGWDFERIIPCHGDVIETGGKGVFRSVMQWFLAD